MGRPCFRLQALGAVQLETCRVLEAAWLRRDWNVGAAIGPPWGLSLWG